MKGRVWAALQETCYYPIDLLQKPALIAIARWGTGPRKLAHISVEPYEYGTEEIDLPNIPQANPSSEDLKRDSGDQALLSKVWSGSEGPPRFTLPLGAPANPLPKGKSFGVKRVFNGKPAPHLHTGADYTTPVGTPVVAVADGTVVAAKDMFFEGNAVFIDHGDGLISMYFHLSEIKVQAGQEVKRATRSAGSDRRVAPRARTCSSASVGITPASTPSSCWGSRARSQPWTECHDKHKRLLLRH